MDGTDGIPGIPGLKGDKGTFGAKGPRGQQGPQGQAGHYGPKGDQGDPGKRGVQGTIGNPGTEGLSGQKGGPGLRGVPGPEGNQGKKGVAGLPGKPGGVGLAGKSVSFYIIVNYSVNGLIHLIKVRAYPENQDQKGTKVLKDDLEIQEFEAMLDHQDQKALWAILEHLVTPEIRDLKALKETEAMMEMKGLLEVLVTVGQ